MPEYVIITKKSIEFIYRHKIELPVDMGDSTTRLTDRMMRKLAEDGVIPNIEADETDDSGVEEISAIFRDNVQVWPRIRKKQGSEKAKQLFEKKDKVPSVQELEDQYPGLGEV